MSIRKLDKAEWRSFFDRLSKALEGQRAEIETTSLSLGAQVQADWVPIIGLVYDPKDDLVELALDGLDHLIHKPRDVYIDEQADMVGSLEIIDATNASNIVKFKAPVALSQRS